MIKKLLSLFRKPVASQPRRLDVEVPESLEEAVRLAKDLCLPMAPKPYVGTDAARLIGFNAHR